MWIVFPLTQLAIIIAFKYQQEVNFHNEDLLSSSMIHCKFDKKNGNLHNDIIIAYNLIRENYGGTKINNQEYTK